MYLHETTRCGNRRFPVPRHPESAPCSLRGLRSRLAADDGATTAEYAIATVAACSFAALLVAIAQSGEMKKLLLGIIRSALALGGV
ncbi:DUF4244 domain-containing protein [Dermabacteraceae bacterium TAE3-ERU5]|nr:DUF4244 domain-containing protein [Dermabacteraceae bacterium TAE3-ERU5]